MLQGLGRGQEAAKSKRMQAVTLTEFRTKGPLIHRSQESSKKWKVRRVGGTSSNTWMTPLDERDWPAKPSLFSSKDEWEGLSTNYKYDLTSQDVVSSFFHASVRDVDESCNAIMSEDHWWLHQQSGQWVIGMPCTFYRDCSSHNEHGNDNSTPSTSLPS